MGTHVEHLEGVNGKNLPTGITNCRSKHAVLERTRKVLSAVEVVVATLVCRGRRRSWWDGGRIGDEEPRHTEVGIGRVGSVPRRDRL
jgi:hypothetical protein